MTNLLNKKFGRLTVIGFDHKEQKFLKNGIKNGYLRYWLCKCSCGNTKVIREDALLSKGTRSCGCLHSESARIQGQKGIHKKTKTRIYRIWRHIKERCLNKNCKNYKNYGARGIKVCDEWKNEFINFYNWAIKNGYNDTLTIDRIDNSGNYEPNNCRWVDMKTQQNNRTNNRLITYKNNTRTIAQWANILNINYDKLKQRIDKLHWSIERAINTP